MHVISPMVKSLHFENGDFSFRGVLRIRKDHGMQSEQLQRSPFSEGPTLGIILTDLKFLIIFNKESHIFILQFYKLCNHSWMELS